jgi:uncharacterized protein YbjT (DUF2867 family)
VSTILVTGPTGHVGRHVVSLLAGTGCAVRALVRDPASASLPEGVEVVRGDLSSPQTLVPALRGVARVYLAHVLASDGHEGAKYVITGPESLTHNEIVGHIGEAIGRDVRWVEFPVEVALPQLTAAWGDAAFAAARLRAWASLVQSPERLTDDVERVLGRPAQTFRSWAREHADDFR